MVINEKMPMVWALYVTKEWAEEHKESISYVDGKIPVCLVYGRIRRLVITDAE